MEEIWKEISEFDNPKYFVSNMGQIKSCYIYKSGKIKEKFKTITLDSKYGAYVTLCKNNISKKYRVGLLVAKTFIPNPQQSNVIRHKNKNTTDNSVENLKWLDKYKTLICLNCQKEFNKNATIYRHNLNKKQREHFFCSAHCRSTHLDELSPFRRLFIYSKAKAKKDKMDFNITLEYLKEIWDKQHGRCPYTGIEMFLVLVGKLTTKKPHKASLDRIDSSKGYVIGNVEFVCMSVNYGKNTFSKQEIQDFYAQIIKNAREHNDCIISS